MSKDENLGKSQGSGGNESALWSIFSYMLSGLLIWGGIGYGLDRWLGTSYLLLAGLLLGMGTALYIIWLRFGRN
jgi:ATP synthase protein I